MTGSPSVNTGPAPLDIQVYAGDRNAVPLEFTAASDPWDISDAVLSAQARLSATDETVAMEAVCTVVDGPNGLATIAWDGEEVRTLLAGAASWSGVWDLQVLEAGQTLPRTMLRGSFVAVMDITREAAP